MIWKSLGFEKDIFFVTPLGPVEEDIRMFVGRTEEVKKFLFDTLNSDRSLKIISGKLGVGKTTFVNACQYYSYVNEPPVAVGFSLPKVAPCFEKIQLEDGDGLNRFIDKSLISITDTIRSLSEKKGLELIGEIEDIVNFYQGIKIKTGSGGKSVGGQVAGFGLSLSGGGSSMSLTEMHGKRRFLESLVGFCKEELKTEGVFVLVNNLDIMSKKQIIDLMNQSRDVLFDLSGMYWILIGQEGLGSLIESEVDRVADYLSGTESKIQPLDAKTLIDIIRVRTNYLKSKDDAKCPLPDEAMVVFHSMSLSELRATFRICGEVVKRVLSKDWSVRHISLDQSISAFVDYAHERARSLELTENNIRILSAVYQKSTCRPKDFKEFGYSSSAGFISALQALVKKQLLSVEEKGKARIYYPTGMTMIAGLTGALGAAIEKVVKMQFEKAKKDASILEPVKIERDQLGLRFEDEEDT